MQSLTRAAPVETDFLNGEIVLAARLLGRAAPANAAVAGRVHARCGKRLPPTAWTTPTCSRRSLSWLP